jgi:hypothetical protein
MTNKKTLTMTEKEFEKKFTELVNLMIKLGMSSHSNDTPIKMIFLGLAAALANLSGLSDDEDINNASINLINAIEGVIESSRLVMEIDIKNSINDLLD